MEHFLSFLAERGIVPHHTVHTELCFEVDKDEIDDFMARLDVALREYFLSTFGIPM